MIHQKEECSSSNKKYQPYFRKKKPRKGCKDNYNAFMVKNAKFEGIYDIPICPSTMTKFPTKIITFVEAGEELKKNNPDFNATVCFSKDDYKFDLPKNGIWVEPFNWLPELVRFEGVVQPDFSTNQDFPRAIKIWNTYRMRAFGCFLVDNGLAVLNNYRSGTAESFDYCTAGIPENSLVFISTHGFIRRKEDRFRLKQGVEFLIEQKKPSGIIVYGCAPDDVFGNLKKTNIPYKAYQTDLDRRLRVAI